MKQIDLLFDRMDMWRHFPNYQLERRADIFFALYLPEVVQAKVGFPVRTEVIPEFPVRKGTIFPNDQSDQSKNIDYIVLSAALDQAVFVELKTEMRSRRTEQDEYLLAARKVGLPGLLEGLIDIFRATNSKRKYFRLLLYLENLGLLQLPASLKEIMAGPQLQGANKASRQIVVTGNPIASRVVYVQPTGEGEDVISFEDFAKVVEKHDDPVSLRFAESLRRWAAVQAGG